MCVALQAFWVRKKVDIQEHEAHRVGEAYILSGVPMCQMGFTASSCACP